MTSKEVLRVLLSLGETSREVAESLRGRGLKGRRRAPCDCPVSNLLQQIGAEAPAVNRMVAVYGKEISTTVKLPSAVGDFVKNFDAGEHPDLEYPQ